MLITIQFGCSARVVGGFPQANQSTQISPGPRILGFTSTNPPSPSNSSTSPFVIGLSSAETTNIILYSDSNCANSIGSGSKALFEGVGITAAGSANLTTTIYAKAYDNEARSSACTLLTTYIHDDVSPAAPGFTGISPLSPSNAAAPIVKGSASADTKNIALYRDSSCVTSIGSGTKAQFEAGGIIAGVLTNTATTIYAEAIDTAGNPSACTVLTTYIHDDVGPAAPAFVSTNPASPSSSSLAPAVRGTSSADTVSLTLYSNAGCTTLIGSGTKAAFETTGIAATLAPNATTMIYAKAADALSNTSDCTLLTSCTHDNIGPASPSFVSVNPVSPSTTLSPAIKGASSLDSISLTFYKDAECTDSIGSGTKASFEGAGITATVPENATTTVYVKAFDAAGNPSACAALTTYTHDAIGPEAPALVSTNPSSPSKTSTTPTIRGTSTADTVSLTLYDNPGCTTSIGAGTKALFESTGITATITANTGTAIFAKAFDSAGNSSGCTSLTTYVHDNVPPGNPVFSNTTPASPSNSSTTPAVKGTASVDTVNLGLYSNAGCTTSIGSGTKALFEDAGITASVSTNATTAIYANAFDAATNESGCVLLTNYTHNSIAPDNPSFTSTNPASPSKTSTSPAVIGTTSAGTVTVTLYDDSGCSNSIGSGTKAQFEGAGIVATTAANSTTAIYAKSVDGASNYSDCTLLTNYTHDNIAPAVPAFMSMSPSSPSSDNSPEVKGTASADTTNLTLYSDVGCTALIGSGTKAVFENAGITAAASANATTAIYAKAFDTATNETACTFLANYTHDNMNPAAPGFTSTTPASPSSNSNPTVKGTSSGDTVSITLYRDVGCSNSIGTGSKAAFEAGGLSTSVTANVTTTIYAKSFDLTGNSSDCTLLTSYSHDNIAPAAPSFTSANPASPSNNSSPTVKGSSSADTASVTIYSDGECATSIGSGTKALFEAAGIAASVSLNATTTIHAKSFDSAGNSSECILFSNYNHDNVAPAAPSYTSASPASPSNESTPEIQGTASADTEILTLYSDAGCSVSIGSGTKNEFEGTGISAIIPTNSLTTIRAKAFDAVGNESGCTVLTNYRHDSAAPSAVTGLAHSAEFPSLISSPSFTWTGGGTEAGSGINRFEYSIGTSSGGTQVRSWTSLGAAPALPYMATGLTLFADMTYYVNVRGIDNVGNISDVASSNGWIARSGPSVTPVYPINGAKWNDYIKNYGSGTTPYDRADAACLGSETGNSLCIHGGEKLKFTATGIDSCTNLTAADSLGAFEWICNGSTNPVVFYSKGLKKGKGLRDLLNPTTFKSNSVTVFLSGSPVLTTSAAIWWPNTVSELPDNRLPSDAAVNLPAIGTSNIYTLSASRATSGYNLNADRISIVTLGNAVLSYSGNSTPNCIEPSGELSPAGDKISIVCSGTQKYFWIETVVDGTHATAPVNQPIYLHAANFARIHRTEIDRGTSSAPIATPATGLQLDTSINSLVSETTIQNTADPANKGGAIGVLLWESDYNEIRDSQSLSNEDEGFSIYGSGFNSVRNSSAANNGGDGYALLTSSSNNKFFNSTSTNNGGYGFRINASSLNSLFRVSASNNRAIHQARIESTSANNDVVASIFTSHDPTTGAGLYMTTTGTQRTVVHSVTTSGLFTQSGTGGNTLSNIVSIANSIGFGFASTWNRSYDLFSAYNTNYGISVGLIPGGGVGTNNLFYEDITVGQNGTDCYVDAGSASGTLLNNACAHGTGLSVAANTGADPSTSFVGKLSIDDSVNATPQSSATADFASIIDWVGFETFFRFWGASTASSFPSTNAIMPCSTGQTCQIYDYALRATDTLLRGFYGTFINGAACPNSVDASVASNIATDQQTPAPHSYLISAIELAGDYDLNPNGNHNGICESNEACLFTPNRGAYQGEGDYSTQSCTFTGGNGVTNVTMYGYPSNGQ